MSEYYDILSGYLKYIRKKTDFVPEISLVLGSGLGDFAKNMEKECIINYSDIPGFPVSTNKMHKGRFIFGYIKDIPTAVMEGRIHFYEGYTMNQVTAPIRLLKILGCNKIIITNAAGGINENFKPGDLMLIKDHISSFVPSPLIGENVDELGTRFPDMTKAYDPEFLNVAEKYGKDNGITLQKGIYLQTMGPNYETPAEIRMYRNMGADAVGMSTTCETIVATHCKMRVLGISCITNMAAGITPAPVEDSEVEIIAKRSLKKFSNLVNGIIPLL